MTILFRTSKLRKQCTVESEMLKTWGIQRSKLIGRRLQAIAAAEVLEDLRNTPGRFHELTGDRQGQLSCSLDGSYRLILVPADDPVPLRGDGGLDWTKVRALLVLGVEDYHG